MTILIRSIFLGRRRAAWLLVGLCGCGPGVFGGISSGDGDEDPTPATSEEPGSTGEPADTSSTSTETSATATATLTTDFVPDHDLYGESCDPWSQDCPDGEKCVPYGSSGGAWDANKCVPVLGDRGVGEDCVYDGIIAATDNCDETSHCWDTIDVDGELVGTCLAFCTGTPDDPMCAPGSVCLLSSEGSITLCIPTCDPLAQDCDPGLACYWNHQGFNCIFTTEDIELGQPCGYINDCAAGLTCLSAEVMPDCEGASCCSSFCALDLGDAECAGLPGTVCSSFFPDEPVPGYENVGVCILP